MSVDINELYRAEIRKIKAAVEAVKWSDPNCYAEFLAQTYFYVNHSTRILSLAGVRTPFSDQDMHLRFLKHSSEERGHEKLLTNDLKQLDRRIEEFKCSPATAALFQSQYYWIEQVSSKALFGYILLLEGLSLECGPQVYETVKQAFPKASGFLKVHIEEDQDHVAHNFEYIKGMSEKELEWIAENIRQTSHHYCNIMAAVAAVSRSRNQSSKAA